MTIAVFSVVNILMRFAPIGAMAFTIGKYGISSLGPLAKLIIIFYSTCIFFIIVVLGGIARFSGFRITRFLSYIKEEILLVRPPHFGATGV